MDLFIYAPVENEVQLQKATRVAEEYGWHANGPSWQRTDGWRYQHMTFQGGTPADKRRVQSAIRYAGCHSYTPNKAELTAERRNTCRTM